MAIEQFSRSLPMMLQAALDAVMPRFRAIFHEFGLTEPQWRVLRVLWEGEVTSARRLADLTLIPPPSLVGVIDRLVQAGLVVRRRAGDDRRAVRLSVTAAGRAIEAKVMPRTASAYADLKMSVDAETWEQLIAGLRVVAATHPVNDSPAADGPN
ncbi:MAG: MarR family transcriptional regulator [Gammaproteobacteria bacterium]|nr:MarR family transcriptional regulator [Gammaproteobacteria bacterium]